MQNISVVFRILILVGVLGLMLFSTGSTLRPISSSMSRSSLAINKLEVNDSAFQLIIDSLEVWISQVEYYRWQQKITKHQLDSLLRLIDTSEMQLRSVQLDSNQMYNTLSIDTGRQEITKNDIRFIKDSIGLAYKPVEVTASISTQHPQALEYQNLAAWHKLMDGWIVEAEQNRMRWEHKLDIYLEQLPNQEARRVEFRGGWYRIFFASHRAHTIQVHANKSGQLQPLSTTWQLLNRKKVIPVCVTNGGMYEPDGTAVGLLIENGQLLHQLNKDSLPVADNFHLYPNGVFYVDTVGRFGVSTTAAFKNRFLASYKEIRQATQSGPMLVINGEIHPKFTYGSPNTNIRNGVGILREAKAETAVFVISETRINLYDFALLFQKVLRCDQALYLDGVISKMYYQNNQQMMGDLGGSLGPVISIVRRTE